MFFITLWKNKGCFHRGKKSEEKRGKCEKMGHDMKNLPLFVNCSTFFVGPLLVKYAIVMDGKKEY